MMSLLATSRRTQLDLLARACAHGERARVAVHAADNALDSATTRFLSLGDRALFLYWPGDERAAALTRGAPVEVYFAHDGDRYSFKSEVQGRASRRLSGKGLVPALMLSLPLRVERKQQRANFRISLASLDPPLEACCTSMIERDLKFTLRATNASCGGMGGVTADAVADRVKVGDLFWAELALPRDKQKIEFVVRLAYLHAIHQPPGQRTKLGCGFYPADDPVTYQDNLHRLECFIIERQQATLKRAAARPARRR